jgi:mono/diheme cytochrome c family protein
VKRPLIALGLAMTIAPLAGCGGGRDRRAYEYMPDMVRGPAYKAYAPNPATRDGLTLQRPVSGTIARGYQPFDYGPGENEAERAGRELKNPCRATEATLGEGRALFETYCAVCHGAGKIPPPPSYRSDRVLEFAPGRIFHVITLGSGKMPGYATQLSADERWKVVTYVYTVLQGREVKAAAAQQGEWR